jgi:integrase
MSDALNEQEKLRAAALKAWETRRQRKSGAQKAPDKSQEEKKAKRRSLPQIFSDEDIESFAATAAAIIAAAKSPARKHKARRDLVMYSMGRYAGLRVSEFRKLHVPDVDLEGGWLFIIKSKNGVDRNIPIAEKLLPLLRDWIGDRRSGLVFPGRGAGGKLSDRTWQRRIKALAQAANVVKRTTPHRLRHTFATNYLEINGNIREVQELLGHSSVQTTEIYAHVKPGRTKRGVDRL